MPARKNNNSTYRLSPAGFILHHIARGINNRSLKQRPTISIPPVRGPRQTCKILDLSANSLFEDSSKCRLICRKANSQCEVCETRTGSRQQKCLSHYRKTMNVCKNCMKNPHKLTQAEIEKITTLNALKFNEDLVGDLASTAPKVKFSLLGVDGNLVEDQSDSELRILFGKNAEPKQIPWHIQFLDDQDRDYQCGGTLITPNKIVSAGHCFSKNYQRSVEWCMDYLVVNAGNIERKLKIGVYVQKRKCSQILVHSLFNPKPPYSNDISIVFTESPFTINDYVRPVALPKSSKFQIRVARTMVSGRRYI